MKEKEAAITEFFNKNQSIINGIGLFVALTGLTDSYIKEQQIAHALSCLFLWLAILLTFELMKNSPREVSDLLYVFRSFFILSMGLFIVYWLISNYIIIVALANGGIFWYDSYI